MGALVSDTAGGAGWRWCFEPRDVALLRIPSDFVDKIY